MMHASINTNMLYFDIPVIKIDICAETVMDLIFLLILANWTYIAVKWNNSQTGNVLIGQSLHQWSSTIYSRKA